MTGDPSSCCFPHDATCECPRCLVLHGTTHIPAARQRASPRKVLHHTMIDSTDAPREHKANSYSIVRSDREIDALRETIADDPEATRILAWLIDRDSPHPFEDRA